MSYIYRDNRVHDNFFSLHDQAIKVEPAPELKPGDAVTERWFNRMLETLGLTLRAEAGQNLTEMSRLAVEELKTKG